MSWQPAATASSRVSVLLLLSPASTCASLYLRRNRAGRGMCTLVQWRGAACGDRGGLPGFCCAAGAFCFCDTCGLAFSTAGQQATSCWPHLARRLPDTPSNSLALLLGSGSPWVGRAADSDYGTNGSIGSSLFF